MALMPRKLIAEQSSNAKVPAEDLRLALTALWTPGGSANAARPGVLKGSGAPGFLGCQVLAPSASTFTVKQGSFIVQQATTNGGAYIGVIDSDQTLTLTPPAAGNFKAGYVLAHCYDSAYGDAQDGFALEVLLGAQATSAAAAVYPAIPTNALNLSGFTVNASGAITLTTAPQFTVATGAILPVAAGDTAVGDYDGQWRDEPAAGLQRWSTATSGWVRPAGNYLGAGASAFPGTSTRPTPVPQIGDTFSRTDVGGGTAFMLTANGWRQAEPAVVPNAAARDALKTTGPNGASSGTVLHAAMRIFQTDLAIELVWDGARFAKVAGINPSLLWSTDDGGASGQVNPGASSVGVLNGFGPVPAHTPGTLRIDLDFEVLFGAAVNAAGFAQLSVGSTPSSPDLGTVGPRTRFHTNGGQIQVIPKTISAFYRSDGAAKYLWLLGWNDPGSAASYAIGYDTWAVWQL